MRPPDFDHPYVSNSEIFVAGGQKKKKHTLFQIHKLYLYSARNSI